MTRADDYRQIRHPNGGFSYCTLLGHILAARRKMLGLKQLTVSTDAGISSGSLSRYEHGVDCPSVLRLHTLALALATSPIAILTEVAALGARLSSYGIAVYTRAPSFCERPMLDFLLTTLPALPAKDQAL